MAYNYTKKVQISYFKRLENKFLMFFYAASVLSFFVAV